MKNKFTAVFAEPRRSSMVVEVSVFPVVPNFPSVLSLYLFVDRLLQKMVVK